MHPRGHRRRTSAQRTRHGPRRYLTAPRLLCLPCPLSQACSASQTVTADPLTAVSIFRLTRFSLSLSAVVCTECMENMSNYSKDPDYLKHGFGPAGGMEYQQHSAPPPHPHCHSGEQHGTGPHSASLCHGTPNGVRKDVKEFSTNHSLLQQNQHDTKGESGVCFK